MVRMNRRGFLVASEDDPELFRRFWILQIFAEASRMRVPSRSRMQITIKGLKRQRHGTPVYLVKGGVSQ